MAKVLVMADEVIVKVILALVLTLKVWQKDQAAWARRVNLLLKLSKGHTSISQALLHYRKSAITRNLLNC